MSEPVAEEYTIGWICALQEEFEAACRMLDDEYDGLEAADPNDDNTYVFGRIHKHNIVIGCLPSGIYGIASAACVARDMVRSFPNLRFALMVGIGGGAPTPERDIRLGDVVVSEPKGELGGVVQYDLGKRLSDGEFKRTGQLNAPPRVLLGALPEVRRRHNDPRRRHSMAENLTRMDDMPEYSRPASDKLFRVESRHRSGKTCDECDCDGLIERYSRPHDRTIAIHYGTIASGNTVIKDATERDRYANDPALNVLCFEMEAAGLMNNFPCIVIRGICDYCDDHKNDEWHNHAALTAAAYARDLLGVVRPQKVAQQPAWAGKVEFLLGEVREGVKEVLHHQRTEDEGNLLRWLSPIDHVKTHIDKTRGRDRGTRAGKWLIDSHEFQHWLSADSQTLFCPGIPGAGKTVLASVVVDNLLGRRHHGDGNQNRTIGGAFIYLDFKQQFKLDQLLGSILRQIAANHLSALSSVEKLRHLCKRGSREPHLSELRDVLNSILPCFSRLFIVVDALDEVEQHLCGALLSEVFDLQQAHGANVFATSRHIPDIERRFEGAHRLEIRAADEDVRCYVDSQMARLPRFVTQKPELQEETKKEIIKAIDGMFLLATLHLDSLVGARSVRAFRDALKSLPTGTNAYDHAYGLAFDRIKFQAQNRRDLAIEVLSWVVYARRHLETSELQHALAVIVGSTHFDESNIPDIDDVVSVCAGLVVVDPERHIVRLVHQTTQEFFEREKQKRLPNAQSYLTTICLAYLSLDCFQNKYRLFEMVHAITARRRPPVWFFYKYAAMNWGYHARETLGLSPGVLKFLKSDNELQMQAPLLALSVLGRHSVAYANEIQRGITGIHVAAYFGILEAVVLFLKDETCIDLKDGHGWTPLSWASSNGQAEVVARFLDTGKVNTNSRDSLSRTPLHLATFNRHLAVMKLLLTRGCVDLNAQDEDGNTPLHLAVLRGHKDTVQELLDHGANLKMHNGMSDEPAMVAIRTDDATIIRLLHEKRPDALDKDLLLIAAAQDDSLAVVRCLVDECKVDVNAKDGGGHTPLLIALHRRQMEIVKFLLANDQIDLMPKDCDGRAPLDLAVSAEDIATVKFLLAKDEIDPNSRDHLGRSALSYAVTKKQLEIVRALVKVENIDVDPTDERGRTPLLHMASSIQAIATEVHSLKAEISQRERNCSGCADSWADKTQQTKVDEAMAKLGEYKAIFNLLVEKGADLEVQDGNGYTIEYYRQRERRHWELYQAGARNAREEACRGNSASCPPCCSVTLHSEWLGPPFSSLLW